MSEIDRDKERQRVRKSISAHCVASEGTYLADRCQHAVNQTTQRATVWSRRSQESLRKEKVRPCACDKRL